MRKGICQPTTFNLLKPTVYVMHQQVFFSPGATTPIGGCILQPSSGL